MRKTIGLRFRKTDFLNFVVGAALPVFILPVIYAAVRSDTVLEDSNLLALLRNNGEKFIFYLFAAFLEELIFRGILFGIMLEKCKNRYFACAVSALVFALPHILNADNIFAPVMFVFPFLYGIFANEMFYMTKSIWMPTGFHWLWNYIITSLFLATGTQNLVYVPITAFMLLLILLTAYVLRQKRKYR